MIRPSKQARTDTAVRYTLAISCTTDTKVIRVRTIPSRPPRPVDVDTTASAEVTDAPE